MAGTHFTGAVTSTNGFVGSLAATTITASTSAVIGGSGATIKGIYSAAISVVVGTNAAAAEADVSLTITGVRAGDLVLLAPIDAAVETGVGICAVWVSANDTVKVRFTNLNAALALNGSTANWNYVWFDLT